MVRRRGLVGVAVGVGLTAAVTMLSPQIAAAADGLAIAATTTYQVDFPAGVVRVQLEMSVENTVAPERGGAGVRSTYFTGWQIGVHGDATALAGRSGDQPIPVSLSSIDPELQLLSITFPEDLDYGERQDLVVTWELPGLPPRSAAPWRTNEAFAAFVAYAYGDPGKSAVRVIAPIGVDVGLPALGLTSLEEPVISTDGVVDVRSFDAIAEPNVFAPVVIASDGARLTETKLDVAGRDVVVQAWPDDPEWTAFMGDQVGTALTDLEQLIGFPVRDDRPVVVRESVAPILEGFAGWFDQSTGVIEVGETLDPALVFHEVGHAWFNDDFSLSRWINEGLAETYANLLLERTGGTPRQPAAPAVGAVGAQPLAEWVLPVVFPPDASAERYGYDTSYFVVDALVDEIGVDAMADVLTAMEEDVEAYRGEGDPAPTTATADWRRLLDLATEVGGAQAATELFRAWVAPPSDLRGPRAAVGDPPALRHAGRRRRWMGRSARRAPGNGALGVRLRRRRHDRRRGRTGRPSAARRRRCACPDRPAGAVRGAVRGGVVGARAECSGCRAERAGRGDRVVVAGDVNRRGGTPAARGPRAERSPVLQSAGSRPEGRGGR